MLVITYSELQDIFCRSVAFPVPISGFDFPFQWGALSRYPCKGLRALTRKKSWRIWSPWKHLLHLEMGKFLDQPVKSKTGWLTVIIHNHWFIPFPLLSLKNQMQKTFLLVFKYSVKARKVIVSFSSSTC